MNIILYLRGTFVRGIRTREDLGQITSVQAYYCLSISDVLQNILPSYIYSKATNFKIRQYRLDTLVN